MLYMINGPKRSQNHVSRRLNFVPYILSAISNRVPPPLSRRFETIEYGRGKCIKRTTLKVF